MSETTSQSTNSSELALFQYFDNWRIDPVISRKLNTLKDYNALLLTTPLSRAELQEWMVAFDSDLGCLVDSKCSFTGMAHFPDARQGDVALRTGDYDAETMYFRGVIPIIIDRPPESDEDRVLYQLQLSLTKQDITPEGKLTTIDGFCEVDQVVRIEFDSVMSIERSIQILESEAPELLSEIDYAIYNLDEDVNPAERILNLKDLAYKLRGDEDDDTLNLIRRALSSYTNHMLAPDSELPYTTKIYGHAWFHNETGSSIPAAVSAHAVVDMRGIIWSQPPDDESVMVPSILVKLHYSDKDKSPESLCVPVSSVEQLESIRYNFYSDD